MKCSLNYPNCRHVVRFELLPSGKLACALCGVRAWLWGAKLRAVDEPLMEIDNA